MRRAERLFRLVNEMRTRDVSRADELAAHFEVSSRTIYRDIAHLQASGLPIEGEAGIGYLLRPGFNLPNLTYTYDQLDALAVGLSFVESTGDPALATAAREVRAKIQSGLPRPEARKLADAPYFTIRGYSGDPSQVELLREAIRKQQVTQIIYQDGDGRCTERRVRPLAIWSFTEGWMFSAWCELRQDFRTFRFDRITDLTITGDTFEENEAKGLHAFLEMEQCKSSHS